jgi:hypothetical protein
MTMKNSCCHSIIELPLRSAQRMIITTSQQKAQTQPKMHRKVQKRAFFVKLK